MICCPQCQSEKTWKDGIREGSKIYVQRHVCRSCGYRFSEHRLQESSHESVKESLNTQKPSNSNYQICALEAKNLEPQTEIKTVAGEISNNDIKGKIVDFSFWMLKEGYS